MTLAKLQAPAKHSFEKVNEDLKEVHQALGKYGKALDKVHHLRSGLLGEGARSQHSRNSKISRCQTPVTMLSPLIPPW